MKQQEMQSKRADYEDMVARGFNDYQECLTLLDDIDEQAQRIAELEAVVRELLRIRDEASTLTGFHIDISHLVKRAEKALGGTENGRTE